MRKSSPRLLAGIIVLGLFAVVGTFTVRAFTPATTPVAAPQGSTEVKTDAKVAAFEETRKGSSGGP